MKLIYAAQTVDSEVRDMEISYCPATAIGHDVSRRCLVADNILVGNGRLAPVTAGSSGAGGSASFFSR